MKNKEFLYLIVVSLMFWACQNEAPTVDNANNQDQTLQAFSEQITQAPNQVAPLVTRANYYYEQESYERAISDLEQALTLDSTNINTLHLLADVYLDYYQSKKAIDVLAYTSEVHPESILTLLKKSEFHLILQQYEESMRTVDQILRMQPNNAEAYFMFGQNFVEQGDTIRAINSFQSAVENDPNLIDAWIKLGQLQAGIGEAIATKYFDSAISIDPENITVRHAKADYYSDQGQLNEAIQTYREIIQINAGYEEAYFNSGLIYLDMDSIPQAYEQFDICIKTSPLHTRAYYYRGLSAEFLGRKEQAASDYKQALSLVPDYVEPRTGLERLVRQGE